MQKSKNFRVAFSLQDKAAAVVEVIKGSATHDDFFRRAIEIGISKLIENAARMNHDYLSETMTGATSDYRMVRTDLFAVEEARPETPKPNGEAPRPSTDPMAGIRPRTPPKE